MDLYERNYILMRRLAPELPPGGQGRVSRVVDGLDLHLRVLERHRYTSDLVLTYRFQRLQGPGREPNLSIRIYHDARVAEVLAAQLRHWPEFPDPPSDDLGAARQSMSRLYTRWRVNRFLYKWLGYCLYQGHRFDGRCAQS
jgi:uncharacterized protein YqiB (DUF1249 family)